MNSPAVQNTALPGGVQPGPTEPDGEPDAQRPTTARPAPSPARDRAEQTARRHAQHHGAWPTVSELETAAAVSRGTAAAALKALRAEPLPLHLLTNPSQHPRSASVRHRQRQERRHTRRDGTQP